MGGLLNPFVEAGSKKQTYQLRIVEDHPNNCIKVVHEVRAAWTACQTVCARNRVICNKECSIKLASFTLRIVKPRNTGIKLIHEGLPLRSFHGRVLPGLVTTNNMRHVDDHPNNCIKVVQEVCGLVISKIVRGQETSISPRGLLFRMSVWKPQESAANKK